MSNPNDRPAHVDDVHTLARAMPHVTVTGRPNLPIYQVVGKAFVFFRAPRADAHDPETGERYTDVIVFHVASETEKQALVQDENSPFFTTSNFDGHRSVLLRASRIGELTYGELTEMIENARLSQVSRRRSPNR